MEICRDLNWEFLDRPQALADELRARHGVETIPVPVAVIAEAEGAIIQCGPLLSEGSLTRTNTGYLMRVNEAAAPVRRRFTIAHEIAHILCDRSTGTYSGTRYRAGSEGVGIREEERFCQRFASYLLIPGSSIAEFASWDQVTLVKLHAKARELQVSTRALLWRVLEQLPYEGGALCFRKMAKPNDPSDIRLRLDWATFPNTRKSNIYRFDAVPVASPIRGALGHSREILCTEARVEFGSLRGTRNLLVKAFGQSVVAIVLPGEVDPGVFRSALQTVANIT